MTEHATAEELSELALAREAMRAEAACEVKELVAHVERLAAQPVLRRRMALAARHSVRGRTWEAVNELLVDHYREVGRTSVTRRRAG